MNTNNDLLRKKRINCISNIISLYNFTDIKGPASVLNLLIFEIECLLKSNNNIPNYSDINQYLHSKLEVISGNSIIGDLDKYTSTINEYTSKMQDGVYFSSLPPRIHQNGIDLLKYKLSDIDLNKYTDDSFSRHKDNIKRNFSLKGDKKKKYLINSIDTFLDSWLKKHKELSKSDKLKYFSEMAGISSSEISLDMTFDSYLKVMERNNKIRIIAQKMGIDYTELIKIDLNHLPSFLFDELFDNAYEKIILKDKPRRVESSILEDKYLSYFSMYFDVIVDIRTAEVLNSIKNQLPFTLKYHINNL
jgi:hypothetical protein